MNRNYKNIIICIAAVLMMLPTVMEASAEQSVAPAGGGSGWGRGAGGEAGVCVIGIPSACNAPEYWWPESWNWDRWSLYRPHPTPIITEIPPPEVTLPVEVDQSEYYQLTYELDETGPDVQVSVEPVEPDQTYTLPVEDDTADNTEVQIMPVIVQADDPDSDIDRSEPAPAYPGSGVIEPPHPPCGPEGPCYS